MTTGPRDGGECYPTGDDSTQDCKPILDAMAEGVVYQDSGGRVIFHNSSAERILGRPVGESFHSAFPIPPEPTADEDADVFTAQEHPAMAALRTGKPSTGVVMGIRRGGELVTWISVNSAPLLRPGEVVPYAVVSTVMDITNRYDEELALRAREKVFRLLVENQNEGIGIVDLEERFLLTNHAGDGIFGVPPGGLTSRSLYDFLAPESRLLVSDQTRDRRAGKRSQYELEIVRECDGARRTILVSAAPYFDDAGRVSGTVGVFSDITDRILVERALQENEARLRLTFDQAPIGAAMVSLDCRYLQVNEAFCRMLGYQERELTGRSVFEVTHPDHVAVTEQNIRRIAEGATRRYETEKRYVRKDGGVVWAHLTVTPLRHSANQTTYLLTMVEDITERKLAESEKARLQAQFLQAQKMESIGRLAGGVAHDFNNLLTVINGYSATVLDLMSPADPLRSRISEIFKAGERASALVRQLLAFSRKQVLKPDLIDLNEMVADMEKMLRPLMGDDVEIIASLAPVLEPVLADRHQMEQVVMNLAVNARDAMPQGGTLTIETSRTVWENACPHCSAEVRPGPYVRVSVRDTGTGMGDEVRQHLFEPFFTTKTVGHGTGLGLATVHGIVLQSGGHIDVETSSGAGTCFHVYLPAVEAIRPVKGHPPLSPPVRGTETILLVEDQAEVRRFAATLLRECGYRVIESCDAEEALAQCAGLRFDLLLTDVVMPKMTGTELASRMLSCQPHVRVLFMSGYSDEVLSWPADSRRGAAFIQKPFTIDALAAKVREVLAGIDDRSVRAASLHYSNLE
jgi:two-component system, cell cycle sensor histidine kinase and response regulator CckA